MLNNVLKNLNNAELYRYRQNRKNGEHGVLLCRDYYLDSVFVVKNIGENISICGIIKSRDFGDFIIGMDNILFIKRQPGLFNISGRVLIDNPDEVRTPELKAIERDGVHYTSAMIYTIYVDWKKVPDNCNRLARKALSEFLGKDSCDRYDTMSVREMYNKIR